MEPLIGLGPHTPKKKQDLDKLYDLKAKAQQIMSQFGPSTLINLSNFSSIKPEPASTPPHSSMANNTTVAKMPGTPSSGGRLSPESSQILTKKKLQDLVREVDPNEQLDEDVEEMLLQIADDFIESVVTAACQLARHRKSNTLEVKDVQLHLGKLLWARAELVAEVQPLSLYDEPFVPPDELGCLQTAADFIRQHGQNSLIYALGDRVEQQEAKVALLGTSSVMVKGPAEAAEGDIKSK
ncbi:UNVERIFIED_CONTAM: hypothetical protein K2H54_053200 [Gekko kuhli]